MKHLSEKKAIEWKVWVKDVFTVTTALLSLNFVQVVVRLLKGCQAVSQSNVSRMNSEHVDKGVVVTNDSPLP